MTPRQQAYIASRRQGLGQGQAARAAGYSPATAAAAASRLERLPAIKAAIEQAREDTQAGNPGAQPEYANAEDFLIAVVAGTTPADPIRVSAARTLIQYQRKRERTPLKGATPTQIDRRDALTDEQRRLDQWAATAAAVRERLAIARGNKL